MTSVVASHAEETGLKDSDKKDSGIKNSGVKRSQPHPAAIETKEKDSPEYVRVTGPPGKRFCCLPGCWWNKCEINKMFDGFSKLFAHSLGQKSNAIKEIKSYLEAWKDDAHLLFSLRFTWEDACETFLGAVGFWTYYKELTQGKTLYVSQHATSMRVWPFAVLVACKQEADPEEIQAFMSCAPSYLPSPVDQTTLVPYVIACPVYLVLILGLLRPFYIRKKEDSKDTFVEALRPWMEGLDQWNSDPLFSKPFPDVDYVSAQFNRQLISDDLNVSAALEFILNHPHCNVKEPLFADLVKYYEYRVFLASIPDELLEAKDDQTIWKICKEIPFTHEKNGGTRELACKTEENRIRNLLVLLKSKLPYSTHPAMITFYHSVITDMIKHRPKHSLWNSLASYYVPHLVWSFDR